MIGDDREECRNSSSSYPSNSTDWLDLARFPSQFVLPRAEPILHQEAAAAIRQEMRDCTRWKRLKCTAFSVIAERDRGTVYVIHVGNSVEFDWTWEGATAFRPRSLDEDYRFSNNVYEEALYADESLWSGEILEVDEQGGSLFVLIDNSECPPTLGPFFVRPFEFLSVLDAIYNEPEFESVRQSLPERLLATQGNIHPRLQRSSSVGQPLLDSWWSHTWAILWGPPGTGKTFTLGQHAAAVMQDCHERILVVSTTNRATDTSALAIGNAAKTQCPSELTGEAICRIGNGAALASFTRHGLLSLLQSREPDELSREASLTQDLKMAESWEERAFSKKGIGDLRKQAGDSSFRMFLDAKKRIVVCTAFKAISYLKRVMLRQMIETGEAPFTTIIIDEAGLMSRAVVAALSLLAAERVVLAGDSRQLAPICRISRLLVTRQQVWLASSALSHLSDIANTPDAVKVLTQQHRMHPDICRVVSEYQYDGLLQTAPERIAHPSNPPSIAAQFGRAIWYVLDEEDIELDSIRATRGPGNKSWIRTVTASILRKLLFDPDLRQAHGLFITPYRAQAQWIAELLAAWGVENWQASTVHSQQGNEADIVIFDSVNAGSFNWPFDEWKRLVNVAISRAREAVIVLASRDEMREPYLRPLASRLLPGVLVAQESSYQWLVCPGLLDSRQSVLPGRVADDKGVYALSPPTRMRMGEQIAQRHQLQPVLTQEQQRLMNLALDGKPRLVRGVAGSGKSLVLCHWLARTAQKLSTMPEKHIWAVYANRSLHTLLHETIESAWSRLHEGSLFDSREFPWQQVSLLHIKDVLAGILPNAALSMEQFGFDYDRASEVFLDREDWQSLLPSCHALFIDEAQDMGPSTLRLLLSMVEQANFSDPNSRSAHIFYDNAQNVYGTKTPTWSEFGLAMRGRSTILRDSYRSTLPITELAVNVLYRLLPNEAQREPRELLDLKLLRWTRRTEQPWLQVCFTQVSGPKPAFRTYPSREAEIESLAKHIRYLIDQEGIATKDICLIYNGKARSVLMRLLAPKLHEAGIELSIQTNRSFERRENQLLATTPQSFKGYEAEVVLIPCVDHFVASGGKILANSLYVAMTRARSLLAIYGMQGLSPVAHHLTETLAACIDALNSPDVID